MEKCSKHVQESFIIVTQLLITMFLSDVGGKKKKEKMRFWKVEKVLLGNFRDNALLLSDICNLF